MVIKLVSVASGERIDFGPMNDTKNSIEAFNEILLTELKGSTLAHALNPAMFAIWFSKLVIFQAFINKIDDPMVCELVTRKARQQSRNSPGFLCSQSFGILVEQASLDEKNGISPTNVDRVLAVGKAVIKKSTSLLKNVYLLMKLRILMGAQNTTAVVFCDRRIETKAVKEFCNKQKISGTLHFFPFKTATNRLSFLKTKRDSLSARQKAELRELLLLAASKSIAKNTRSDFDMFVPGVVLTASIDEWEAYFPNALLRSTQERIAASNHRRDKHSSIILIDDSGEVLRNKFLTSICRKYEVNLYGYQHGGQYGEIRSILCSFEIANAAYDLGFLGWGFGLKKANFRKTPSKHQQNKIGLYDIQAVLYPQSVDARDLAHTSTDAGVIEKIELTKVAISESLQKLSTNYWIKRHPKSQHVEKHLCNFDTNQIRKTTSKPTIDGNSIQLVVFDAPGQSLMYSCLDEKVRFLFCFSLSSYNLTNAARNYFKRLEDVGLFVDSDKPDVEARLKVAVEKSLRSPFCIELVP